MNDIERVWRQLLKDINNKGDIHYKDDAEIKEVLNVSAFISNPAYHFGVTISREDFLDYIRKGYFDISNYSIKGDALADYVESIDDKDKIYFDPFDVNNFVYTYPERLKNILSVDKGGCVDNYNQINIIINRLKYNMGSNRAVATLYSCGLDDIEQDIPCLNWMQALIRDNELYLAVIFRSNDIYNAFPSNMLLLMNIGMYITEELQKQYPNLSFAGVYYNCTSAHYYTDVVTDEIIKEIVG